MIATQGTGEATAAVATTRQQEQLTGATTATIRAAATATKAKTIHAKHTLSGKSSA